MTAVTTICVNIQPVFIIQQLKKEKKNTDTVVDLVGRMTHLCPCLVCNTEHS